MADSKETIIKSALKYLVKMQIEEGSVGFAVDNDYDHDCCWDDVFAWLEAQPCEDAVSRSEAIDKLTKFYNMVLDDNGTKLNIRDIVGTLERLPSVTPKPSEDCISRESVLKFIDKMPSELTSDGRRMIRRRALEEYISDTLPSVTPQRPKGKWIEISVENDIVPVVFKCSECEMRVINPYNYCPNCGSYNGGMEDADSN